MRHRSRHVALAITAFMAVVAVGCRPSTNPPTPPTPANYVALGDSYTAGPLIPLQRVSGIPAGCLQSTNNYPHEVAPDLLDPSLDDASCSGATTEDMTSPQSVTLGPNSPQFDRLKPETNVVTVGIGGNDIGFAEIAVACAQGGLTDPNGSPCQDTYVQGANDTISARIEALRPKLDAVLDGIHARSPSAKVFVVGYPAILPDTGTGCYPVMPITPLDVPYVRAKELELNATIQQAAIDNGDIYVDTYTPSIGHDACQLVTVKWIEPIVPTEPAAPVHPNARGEAGMATAVLAAMATNGVAVQP
jgi:hypothetical protein